MDVVELGIKTCTNPETLKKILKRFLTQNGSKIILISFDDVKKDSVMSTSHKIHNSLLARNSFEIETTIQQLLDNSSGAELHSAFEGLVSLMISLFIKSHKKSVGVFSLSELNLYAEDKKNLQDSCVTELPEGKQFAIVPTCSGYGKENIQIDKACPDQSITSAFKINSFSVFP